MNRYLLFFGEYYPCEGWYDFKGSFDSIEDARELVKKERDEDNYLELDWYQIVDSLSGAIVEKGTHKQIAEL